VVEHNLGTVNLHFIPEPTTDFFSHRNVKRDFPLFINSEEKEVWFVAFDAIGNKVHHIPIHNKRLLCRDCV
jgi:hypothetical protein